MTESELHSRIKWAIAKELIEMGYMTGVEVHKRSENIVIFDVAGIKNGSNKALAFEVYMSHVPDWWKERLYGDSSEEQQVLLHPKQQEELNKLKSFIATFNGLAGIDPQDVYKDSSGLDVQENALINQLVEKHSFTIEDVKSFIKKAMMNGQIYESKTGVYRKA